MYTHTYKLNYNKSMDQHRILKNRNFFCFKDLFQFDDDGNYDDNNNNDDDDDDIIKYYRYGYNAHIIII